MIVRTRLFADTVIPSVPGRIILCRSNYPAIASEIEWFDSAGVTNWVVPETVNGYYYILETEERMR